MADYNPLGRTRAEREELHGGGQLPKRSVGNSDFEQAVWDTMRELGDLLLSKHRDYGPKNISDSPGGALNGLRVRMHDKTARINNLIDNQHKPVHEPLEDSFKDLANYGIIALLVLRDKWDK
jgi:Nucleotide modification associated domain 1